MAEFLDVAPIEGFEREIGLLLASLEDGTREWTKELGDVDEETLVWRPFPGGPSIGSEIMHIAEVEAWWIQENIAGRPLTDEFKRLTLAEETDQDAGRWGEAPRMPLADYLDVLSEVRARTHDVLWEEPDPARLVQSDPDHRPDTVRWIVSHVVQHEAYHGGQAVLLKRLAEEARRA